MSDKTGDTGVPLKDAARGRSGRSGKPADATHRRAPFPADRSITWTPRRDPGDAAEPAATGPYELFIAQSALRDISEHVSGLTREARFGFLLGALFRCPDSGIHYAVVDRSLPADEPFSEEAPAAFLLRAWAECQEEFLAHGGVLLGWYHSHYLLGLLPSEGDQEANVRYFGEPWQCSVLVVPDEERPMGGVFRPGEEVEGLRSDPAAFRELLAPGAMPDEGPVPTGVAWTNYTADRAVAPVEAGATSGGETPAEIRPALLPGGAYAESVTLVLPGDSSERLYPRLRRHYRRTLWTAGAVAALIALVFLVRGLFEGGARQSAERPPPSLVSPEVRRFQRLAQDLDGAAARYTERSQDFDLGRIGCDLLSSGYAATDDAFITMAKAFATLGAPADSARTAEYERLVGAVNDVNRHFDASGCQRPR